MVVVVVVVRFLRDPHLLEETEVIVVHEIAIATPSNLGRKPSCCDSEPHLLGQLSRQNLWPLSVSEM